MQDIPIILPVVYREPSGDAWRYCVSTVETALRSVSGEDAPVAIRWSELGVRNREREYRAFAGRLLGKVYGQSGQFDHLYSDPWPLGRDATAELWLSPRGLGHATAHPLLAADPRIAFEQAQKPYEPVADPGDNAAYAEAAARTLRRAEGALVVDGSLHLPSIGPVVVPSVRQVVNRLDMVVSHGESWPARKISHRFAMLGALDLDAARDSLLRQCDHVHIAGSRPQVLSREGYEIDLEPIVAEALAWHMVWVVAGTPVAEAPSRLMAAALHLRRSLGARWPDLELNFSPSRLEHASPPDNGGQVSWPGSDLLAAMADVADAARGTVDDAVLRRWVHALDRAEAASANYMAGDDVTAMTGLSFG